MNQNLTLEELVAKAEVILFLSIAHPGILPKTTVTRLTQALKPKVDKTMQVTHLTEAIRLAELPKHVAKFEAAIAEDAERQQQAAVEAAEFQRLLDEEAAIDALAAKIEDKKLEAIGLHNYLDENRDYIHPSKVTTKFDPFLGELEDILACNVVSDEQLANVEAWIGRALTFKQGIDNKRRQAPRQTERIAA